MATIAQIREGLKTRLETIDGWQVSAYMLASPSPPTIQVFPQSVEYDLAMGRGLDMPRFTVQAVVALSSDIGAQMKLDELLAPSGASSVKAAIQADATLGGVVDDLRVSEAHTYGLRTLPDGALVIACEWTVEILD